MGYYWAKFKEHDNLYRFDTRIYFESVNEILDRDECIGAVVGKNPGSAIPNGAATGQFCEINLNNDKFLPTVRSIIRKSNPNIVGRKYIQILNLFYLCNPNLGEAIKDFESANYPKICETETKKFPWVWFMWGLYKKKLTSKKKRFTDIQTSKKFYLDNQTGKVVESFPEDSVCAKHTQGMKQDLVIPYLRQILK